MPIWGEDGQGMAIVVPANSATPLFNDLVWVALSVHRYFEPARHESLKILSVFCVFLWRVQLSRVDGAANLCRSAQTGAPPPYETATTSSRASPLSGATFVAMMQSTDLGDRHNLACTRWLDRSFIRRVLLKTQVRAAPMIIIAERE
jgi:hypothetical protein